jgi:hypothetical protein
MADKKHKIEIPEYYLLTIAVYGKMGEGELPDLMATWARRLCAELGLENELRRLQDERYQELKRRLQNVFGDEFVAQVDVMTKETVRKLVGGGDK